MIQIKSSIVSNERLTEDCWRITLEAPQIASEIKPGQFINVKIGEMNDPLLRRPFSVFRRVKLDRGALGIEVVYKVVGRGTKFMTNLGQGDKLDVIGPLGHGFEWYRDKKAHVLLAGGMGSAGLFMLGEEISKAVPQHGLELYTLLGAETKKSLVLEKEFATLNGTVFVSTDDGTYGYHGLATEMLKDAIDGGKIPSDCAIYACGPEPMLRVLASICQQYRILAQISIERHMMCGIGACLVCVCKIDKNSVLKYRDLKSSHIQLSPEGDFGYALVCKDGPVFNIDEVIFDE